jgi:sialate O-acetylesterase
MAALLAAATARCETRPNSIFSEGCVLQREIPVPVWGTAADGTRVTVKFGGRTATATAANGVWKVWLKPMNASAIPRTMVVLGDTTCTIGNVLVGDVWVAGGQSNMERQLGPRPPQPEIIGWKEAAASADFPQIRQFYVPENLAVSPASEARGGWAVCSAQTAQNFSAVGFFFARAIFRAERVPVGILFSAYGGTAAEAWTSASSLRTVADFRGAVERMDRLTGDPDRDKNYPTVLYNAMIAPLQAFPIKGVIWYQGESNCDRGLQYRTLFPLLISDWRRGWGLGDIPFLFVQIAPSKFWTPEIREAQLLTLASSRNTAMICTADIGDANDMHPAQKAPVGERLALAARALAYGEAIEYSGPLFDSLKIEEGRAVVSFTHTEGGLVAAGGELKGFVVSGADGKFVPAKAEIKGNTVVVSSEAVRAPAAVRYGWEKAPDINLFNGKGLPASPFRTDFERPFAGSD